MSDFTVTVTYRQWVFCARTESGRDWVRRETYSVTREAYVVPRYMGPMVWRTLREERLSCEFV